MVVKAELKFCWSHGLKEDYAIADLPLSFARVLQNLSATAVREDSLAAAHPVMKQLTADSYKRFKNLTKSAEEAYLGGSVEEGWHLLAKAFYEVGFADGVRGANYEASRPLPEEASRANGRKGGNQKRVNHEEKRKVAVDMFVLSVPPNGFKSPMEFENALRVASRKANLSATDSMLEKLKSHEMVAPLWRALRAR